MFYVYDNKYKKATTGKTKEWVKTICEMDNEHFMLGSFGGLLEIYSLKGGKIKSKATYHSFESREVEFIRKQGNDQFLIGITNNGFKVVGVNQTRTAFTEESAFHYLKKLPVADLVNISGQKSNIYLAAIRGPAEYWTVDIGSGEEYKLVSGYSPNGV